MFGFPRSLRFISAKKCLKVRTVQQKRASKDSPLRKGAKETSLALAFDFQKENSVHSCVFERISARFTAFFSNVDVITVVANSLLPFFRVFLFAFLATVSASSALDANVCRFFPPKRSDFLIVFEHLTAKNEAKSDRAPSRGRKWILFPQMRDKLEFTECNRIAAYLKTSEQKNE